MPNLLLLDTVSDICSVAIAQNETVLASRKTENFKDHGRVITTFIEECFDELSWKMNQIDAVVVSAGPGSFTSLRIGYSTAKGLCMGLDIPLITVDTLTSLAQAAVKEGDDENTFYAPMLDARSMGVYLTIFNRKLEICQPLSRQKLDSDSLSKFYTDKNKLILCGNASHKYEEELNATSISIRPPKQNSAAFLLPLALKAWNKKDFADVAYATPNYVAPPNITKPKKKIKPIF